MFFKKSFADQIIERAIIAHRHSRRIIVFPEIDDTILRAASIIIHRRIAHPLILGKPDSILEAAKKLKIHNITREHAYDYLSQDIADFTKLYFEMNNDKKMSMDDARSKMQQPHYFGAMMVQKGLANGMISGIHGETKPYYPAFEVIKTREGIKRVSGLFIMMKEDKIYLFADCVLNIDPDPETLAEIALCSAETAISFGIKPQVAMLSFSTHGSAKHALVDKVRKATELIKAKEKDIPIDGEIQLDAAIVPEVARKKCPDSPLGGNANVLIFPNLDSANIGCKLVERFGGYQAIGPIMQGLNKPINDLSRGSSVDDVVRLTAITVIQGL
jgi:phosphate acetyltransferase